MATKKREKKAGRRPHSARVTGAKPGPQGWRTTDEEEIERRRQRAAAEPIEVRALERGHPVFGTFEVRSAGGQTYLVEIRSLGERTNSCGCPDHRVNGLGTCKHVEAVLGRLRRQLRRRFEATREEGSERVEIYLLAHTEPPEPAIDWGRARRRGTRLDALLSPFFSAAGRLSGDPLGALPALLRRLEESPKDLTARIRLSRHLEGWLEGEQRRAARTAARQAFLAEAAAGKRSTNVVRHPLYAYQVEGALHLAFGERALLGDEMGLGKTVQAVAACELLRRERGIERVLVVSPASLKAEWEEQIAKFTGLPSKLIYGGRAARLRQYREPGFFYLTNYEQIVSDGPDIERLLAPDVVILDEAQRIKNWQTKTAQAVKRLESRYAFVLTGTPLENRIDDVYSIVQFLDPAIFGPLFRFNRDFYQLDDRGRPTGYQNLGELHRRLKPVLLRRRKEEVEDQLPGRTVNTYFVAMEPEQALRYDEHNKKASRLLSLLERRPLTEQEFQQLQMHLGCMRMLCDTPYILDPECRICPKLGELEEILGERLSEDGTKVLIFSEWTRMLELVAELARSMGVGFALHTGSVPQPERRKEIRRFKDDPSCRLFLSSDSGSVGLNLQAASVVINLDLPWNPARLEQRIARAWRKHQTRTVQVINLVTESSIEHRMMQLLAAKLTLAASVLDGAEDLDTLPLPSGRAAFIERLGQVLGARVTPAEPEPEATRALPAPDPAERLHQELRADLGERLLLLERHHGADGAESLLVVVESPANGALERAREAMQRSFSEASSPPTLELLDRATYETLLRLAEQGIVQLSPAVAGLLHRSPSLGDARGRERDRRLERARNAFQGGERKLRMAALLAGSGFGAEALAPLAEALDHGLRGLAWLAGAEIPEEGPFPLASEAGELLAKRNGSTVGALTLRGRLGAALAGEPAVDEGEVQGWVQAGQSLLGELTESLNRAALGGGP